VGDVLSSQEAEFLGAWRARMYDVQREVASLRATASASAAALARDEKLRELEKTRDWFRAEALRLDALATAQAGEISALRERLAAVSDDAAWLEGRAKAATATEVRLRARVEELEAAAAAAAAAAAEGGAGAGAAPRTPAKTPQHKIGTATLAALSPARRTALLAKIGGGGGGGATPGAAARDKPPPAATGDADAARLRAEVARLAAENAALRESLTAAAAAEEVPGGGAGADVAESIFAAGAPPA
jgi:hypothetical protein